MNRKQRLLNQGFIARVEFEQSQVDYKGQLESVRAQQANVDIAKKLIETVLLLAPFQVRLRNDKLNRDKPFRLDKHYLKSLIRIN